MGPIFGCFFFSEIKKWFIDFVSTLIKYLSIVIFYIQNNFFFCHLGQFPPFFSFVNRATMNIGAQVSLWVSALSSSGYIPGSGLLGVHMVILCLAFWGTTKLFSAVTTLFYVPASNMQVFRFFHILTNTSFPFSDYSYARRYEVEYSFLKQPLRWLQT